MVPLGHGRPSRYDADQGPALRKNEPPKPSRLEEARQVIGEYAASLREIINKLRRRIN
jgi:hypothetical protein